MKNRIYPKLKCVSLVLLLFPSLHLYGWGFHGHKTINRLACYTMPPELFGFFKEHIDFLTEHAVDPDKRRYSDKAEAPRHYIDLDRYGNQPFDSLPLYWKDAVLKYTEDTLQAHGIVPWHIPRVVYNLTEAFRTRNTPRILREAANLGHYIGDAHVPLHCTSNYNGQLTGQHGIHGFWESRLPELFSTEYDFLVGSAVYIPRIQEQCWIIIRESAAALDSVLNFERLLTKNFPGDKKYAYESRGQQTVRVYSQEFSQAYHAMLNGQVERRMRAAIQMVGSFWYTAWVNAGSPDLQSIPRDTTEVQTEFFSDTLIQKGRLCDHDN